MKRFINHIFLSACCLAGAFTFGSCDTDVEPVDLNEPDISSQNSALYEQYLSSLRGYKAAAHKTVVAYFDNSVKQPYSQGQILTAAPDSIDYLVLTSPANTTEAEMAQMAELRAKKATKVLYSISFESIQAVYSSLLKDFEANADNAGKSFISFNDFLVDSVRTALTYCAKYNYDGIVMAYEGKAKLYMSEEEKEVFTGYENDFIGIATDWAQRNTDRVVLFQGKPQNVIDQTIFSLAKYIILPCTDQASESGMAKVVNMAAAEGVPSDKFIPMVSVTSLDATDKKTGYWGSALALTGAARWVAAYHKGLNIAGLAIDQANNDYYHAGFTYPTVRQAIGIINPSVKN